MTGTVVLSEVVLRPLRPAFDILLRGVPELVDEVCGYTAPFLEAVPASRGPAWVVTVRECGVPAATAPNDEPAHEVRWDAEARTLTVTAPPRWLPVLATRNLWTLVRAAWVRAGALPLHAAGVELAGAGIVLVGEKWAGKTTAALSLSRALAARFVCNDDVLLTPRPDGRWEIVGGPRSVGVRADSLAEHRPPLTAAALAGAAVRHPGRREDKTFLLPAEVGALGGDCRPTAPSTDVVVELLAVDGAVSEVERLRGRAAADLVAGYLEPEADRRQHDLLDAVGRPRPLVSARTVASVADQASVLRYRHPRTGWVSDFLTFLLAETG
ncbi:hypothetical protein [Actinophytocola sediminis]